MGGWVFVRCVFLKEGFWRIGGVGGVFAYVEEVQFFCCAADAVGEEEDVSFVVGY